MPVWSVLPEGDQRKWGRKRGRDAEDQTAEETPTMSLVTASGGKARAASDHRLTHTHARTHARTHVDIAAEGIEGGDDYTNSYETQTEETTTDSRYALDLLQWVMKWGHETSFPNLLVMLRTFLATCTCVASCERSFSKLKRIRVYLYSSIWNESDLVV